MPALRAADQAVKDLNQADINDLKANKNPMFIIRYVLDTVCIFFKEPLEIPIKVEDRQMSKKDTFSVTFLKDSWDETRKVLSDTAFRNRLEFFERDEISEETIELLSVYTAPLSPIYNYFNYEKCSLISKAAAGILKWVLAIQEYHIKSKIVKPKRMFLAVQEGKLKVAMAELKKNQEELAAVQAKMDELKGIFSK